MIVQSTGAALHTQLRAKGCRVGSNDLRLKVVSKKVSYRSPDIRVICQPPNFVGNRKTIDNPAIVSEVLSPSTALEDYTQLASVQSYWLISQDQVKVERYWREQPDKWVYKWVTGLDAKLELPSIGVTLTLAERYLIE